jgi:hypothetical protein
MNTGAHPLKAGFNQSGGAYFMVISDLEGQNAATPTAGGFVQTLLTAGSNSGGAFTGPTLSNVTMGQIVGAGTVASNASKFVAKGALLKDMGKTVVSSGRVFRKFAPTANGSASLASSFGVVGGATAAPNAGYASFYLEVGREGQGTATPAPIARYF